MSRDYSKAYDSLKDVIDSIANGELDIRNALREALKKEEIHILKLSKANVERLHDLINLELVTSSELGNTASGLSPQHLEALGTEINTAVSNNTGIDLEAKKWAAIESYRKLLNAHSPKDEQYDLGHRDHSISIIRLALIKEFYNFNTSSDLRTKNTERQKQLIDESIAALSTIDSMSKSNLSKIQGKAKRLGATKADLQEVLKMAGAAGQIDVTSVYEQTFDLLNGTGKIAIDLELRSENAFKGSLSAGMGKAFIGMFRDKFKKDVIGKYLNNLDVFNLHGSPSFKENLTKQLDSTFFDKKKKKLKQKSKVRLNRRIPSKNAQALQLKRAVRKRTKDLKTKITAARKKKKFIIPTVTLKAIINESLKQHIRSRMGSSTDPAIKLRYQTGRFAESAKLLTLNRQSTGIFIGTYGFDRIRYGTFLPGGRLSTQQRDPKLYIEGAIRDISMQVLRGQFKGIALGLK